METLINIAMVCSFIMGMFFTVAKLTGNPLFKFVAKTIGLLGTLLPIIYFLKIFQII